MEIVAVLVGAALAFGIGVPWYMLLSKPWMAAAGVNFEDTNQGNALPYISALVAWLITSFFLQNYLMKDAVTLLDSLRPAFAAWVSLGLLSTVLSTMYGMRGKNLLWIDGGYTLLGALSIAVVHHLMG